MKLVVSCLVWSLVFDLSIVDLQGKYCNSYLIVPRIVDNAIPFIGGEAARFTNGFPSRLVYNVFYPGSGSTRLIPEMNFTCNGVIVGYTVAGNSEIPGAGAMIQVWRENSSQPGVYYNISGGIEINGAWCITGGRTEMYTEEEVQFHCDLITNKTTNKNITLSVQPEDILGLELPPNSGLAFARVTKGPTNYVFHDQSSVSSPIALSSQFLSNSMTILPQVTLEIKSGRHAYSNYYAPHNNNNNYVLEEIIFI